MKLDSARMAVSVVHIENKASSARGDEAKIRQKLIESGDVDIKWVVC